MASSPDATGSAAFTPMRVNAVKLVVLLILLGSTFGVLSVAPQMDALWGDGVAYCYAGSALLVLYLVLVWLYIWYMRRHPEKDVQ